MEYTKPTLLVMVRGKKKGTREYSTRRAMLNGLRNHINDAAELVTYLKENKPFTNHERNLIIDIADSSEAICNRLYGLVNNPLLK